MKVYYEYQRTYLEERDIWLMPGREKHRSVSAIPLPGILRGTLRACTTPLNVWLAVDPTDLEERKGVALRYFLHLIYEGASTC